MPRGFPHRLVGRAGRLLEQAVGQILLLEIVPVAAIRALRLGPVIAVAQYRAADSHLGCYALPGAGQPCYSAVHYHHVIPYSSDPPGASKFEREELLLLELGRFARQFLTPGGFLFLAEMMGPGYSYG